MLIFDQITLADASISFDKIKVREWIKVIQGQMTSIHAIIIRYSPDSLVIRHSQLWFKALSRWCKQIRSVIFNIRNQNWLIISRIWSDHHSDQDYESDEGNGWEWIKEWQEISNQYDLFYTRDSDNQFENPFLFDKFTHL